MIVKKIKYFTQKETKRKETEKEKYIYNNVAHIIKKNTKYKTNK